MVLRAPGAPRERAGQGERAGRKGTAEGPPRPRIRPRQSLDEGAGTLPATYKPLPDELVEGATDGRERQPGLLSELALGR